MSSLVFFLNLGDSVESHKKSGQWERFVNLYLTEYTKAFDQVYVFSYGQEKAKGLPANCQILTNDQGLHRFIYTIWGVWRFRKIISRCQVSRTMQATGGVSAILAQKLWSVKAVVNYGYDYGQFAYLKQGWIGKLLTNWYVRLVLNMAESVIVTTTHLEKSLPDRIQRKCVIIPNGVDLRLFSEKKNYALHDPVRVISIGRLSAQKRFSLAIKALRLIKKHTIKLTIIGDGAERSNLVKMAQQNGVELSLVNPLPHREIAAQLQASDIYLHTSVIEGHPKALMEAMSVGLPCVVSSGEELEYVPHSALVNEDPEAIARKIADLLASDQRRKDLGRTSRRWVQDHYDIKETLQKEVQLLVKTSSRV